MSVATLVAAAAVMSRAIPIGNKMKPGAKISQMEINIPATKVTSLKPGGLHVMLFGLNSLLKKGDKFPISLTFENAGQATVHVHIEDVGSMKLNKNKTKHAH